MSDDTLEEPGIKLRAVQPGWQAILKEGDGTARGFWGPTRAIALNRARGGSL